MLKRMRAIAVLNSLAACALLSGCGGDGKETRVEPDTVPDTIRPAASVDTVVIHMTGLLLVVPPTQPGQEASVLLPKIDGHAARFGFGVDTTDANARQLCTPDADALRLAAWKVGICYVDLDEWKLATFGTGGMPQTSPGMSFPQGVRNVTEASGQLHRVHRGQTAGRRGTVTFAAGEPGKACSLATWWFQPVDAQETELDSAQYQFVNLLEWRIQDPPSRQLVFESVGGQSGTVTLPLPAAQQGRIDVILAHVPNPDLAHLPPGNAPALNPASAPEAAVDFDAFYNVLHHRNAAGGLDPIPANSRRRRLPHHSSGRATIPCSVTITSGIQALVETAAIGTYACIVGRATGE
jgi:hypothetical protein